MVSWKSSYKCLERIWNTICLSLLRVIDTLWHITLQCYRQPSDKYFCYNTVYLLGLCIVLCIFAASQRLAHCIVPFQMATRLGANRVHHELKIILSSMSYLKNLSIFSKELSEGYQHPLTSSNGYICQTVANNLWNSAKNIQKFSRDSCNVGRGLPDKPFYNAVEKFKFKSETMKTGFKNCQRFFS